MRELIKKWEKQLGKSIKYAESPDSSYIEINGTQLTGLSVMLTDIKNIRFVDCDLTGSKFTGSKLTGVAFEDCNLTNCYFSNVVFGDYNSFNKSHGSNISFVNANVRNQLNMEYVQFDTCYFNGLKCEDGWLEANYSSITNSKFIGSANLRGNFKYTNFEGSDFSHLDLGEFISGAYQIDMSRTILTGSALGLHNPKSIRTLHMALMCRCHLTHVNAKSVDFSYANMNNAVITDCSFEDCVFDHVVMTNSTIKDTSFQYGCVSYTDLRNSEVIDVKLHNVNMDATNISDIKANNVTLVNCHMMFTIITDNVYRKLTIVNTDDNMIGIICADNNTAIISNRLNNKMVAVTTKDNTMVEYIKSCYTTKGVN